MLLPAAVVGQELAWPVEFAQPWESVQSPFGPRVQNGETDFHRGLDIAGTTADTIVAAADGEVFRVYPTSDPDSPYTGGGNTVILQHDFATPESFHGEESTRYYTLYQHLSAIEEGLTQGDSLSAGDAVGVMGDSGMANTVHLHFEVRLQTTCTILSACNTVGFDPAVNPMRYLEYERTEHVKLRLRRSNGQLRARVRVPRSSLDFNRIHVVTRNAQGRVLKKRTVNFQWRTGVDTSSLPALDTMNTTHVRIIPKSIGSTGAYHTVHFRFKKLLNKKTHRVSVSLSDAQSRTLVERQKRRSAIGIR